MRLLCVAVPLGCLAASGLGCGLILGLDDFGDRPGSPGSGQGGHAAGAVGGQGGDSGAGAQGGAGGEVPCGNGRLDAGETCDGDCPIECIDPDLCTSEKMNGAPDTCDATCPFEEIILCKSDDGCCPAGCFFGNDKDCDQKVIVVARDSQVTTIATALTNTGLFAQVDQLDVGMGAPTAAQLDGHTAALVYTFASWADAVSVGDALADFFDTGGRVVVANGANCGEQYRVRGRFETDGYHILEEAALYPNMDSLGEVLEPESPLMTMVTAFNASIHCASVPIAGAKVVATYATTGYPAVVRAKVKGKNRVDVNIFPPGDVSQPGVARLLANALLYPGAP